MRLGSTSSNYAKKLDDQLDARGRFISVPPPLLGQNFSQLQAAFNRDIEPYYSRVKIENELLNKQAIEDARIVASEADEAGVNQDITGSDANKDGTECN